MTEFNPEFADSRVCVEEAIVKYNEELKINSELRKLLSSVRVFCIFKTQNKIIFGSSKFVGYKNLDARTYLKYNRICLDGRKTEKILKRWYRRINEEDQKYDKLYAKLEEWISEFKRPIKNKTIKVNFRIPI